MTTVGAGHGQGVVLAPIQLGAALGQPAESQRVLLVEYVQVDIGPPERLAGEEHDVPVDRVRLVHAAHLLDLLPLCCQSLQGLQQIVAVDTAQNVLHYSENAHWIVRQN